MFQQLSTNFLLEKLSLNFPNLQEPKQQIIEVEFWNTLPIIISSSFTNQTYRVISQEPKEQLIGRS